MGDSEQGISREEKDEIFDLIFGFFDVKALTVAIDHRLLTIIAETPMTRAQLAEKTKLPERGLHFLLVSLSSLGLIEEHNDLVSPTAKARKFFVEGSPFYQGQYVRYGNWVFDACNQFHTGLRENRPIWEGFSHYVKDDPRLETDAPRISLMNDAMTASQAFVSEAVFRHVDLSDRHRLLDIGGGHGRFAKSAIDRFPQLTASVMDLKQVCEEAVPMLAKWDMSDKIRMVPSDFVNDPFPTGFDVISFIRIFNSRTSDVVMQLLRKAYAALPSGGLVIVSSAPILNRTKIGRQAARLAMLHAMGSLGEPHYLGDYVKRLKEAGFVEPHVAAIDDPYGVLCARKPYRE